MLYQYKGIIQRVIDADTMVIDIDLGFDTWIRNQHVRCFGVDAFELREKDELARKIAHKAKQHIELVFPKGSEVWVNSHRYQRDSFKRVLADVDTIIDPESMELGVSWIGTLLVNRLGWIYDDEREQRRHDLLEYWRTKEI